MSKIKTAALPGTRDKGVVEISKIVIDSAASRDPSGNADVLLFGERKIDLRIGILIFSDHHGGGILPQEKEILLHVAKEEFLDCQVEMRICCCKHQNPHRTSIKGKSKGLSHARETAPKGSNYRPFFARSIFSISVKLLVGT